MLAVSPFKSHFIPAKAPGTAVKVLILVHGRTGNLRVLEWYSKRFDIPELSFLSVEAPYPDQRPDQTEPGFSWYLAERKGLDESRQGLLKMLEELQAQGVSARNVFWLGFSQGAAMSLDMALRSPYQMGGFFCISGFCVESATYPKALGPFAKQQRVLITHGSRDEIISLEDAKKTYEFLEREKIPHSFKVFNKAHSFHLRDEVPLLESTLRSWIHQTEISS
jgi:predicted esterase